MNALFGFWITQSIEDHDPQQGFGIKLAPGAQHPAKSLRKPQFIPQGRKHPGIAKGSGRSEINLSRSFIQGRATRHTKQAIDQGIGFSRLNIFQTPQSGNDLLARHARSIAVGLHELDILARTGSGDLYKHVAIVIRQQNDSQSEKHDSVSLQDFSVQKSNPMILLGGHGKKRRFYGANCRTRVFWYQEGDQFGTECRVIPHLLIHPQPHKPAIQQVVVNMRHQLPFGSDREQGLKQTGPEQSLRRNRDTTKIGIQPIQFAIHAPLSPSAHQHP